MGAATCPRCGLAATPGPRCARCGADLTHVPAASRATSHEAELLLVGATGESAGQRWTVSADAAVVGRAATADVHIDHRSISRTHCRITRENDEFFIEDAGGQNGTFLDGKRVTSKSRIADGSRIGVAQVELLASVSVPAQAAVPAGVGRTMVVDVSEALEAAAAVRPDQTEQADAGDVTLDGLGANEIDEPTSDMEDAEQADVDDATMTDADETGATGEIESIDETEAVEVTSSDLTDAASIDALSVAADEFWRRFEAARAALLQFRERYVELGGREAALDVAAQAMVIEEQSESATELLPFGQQAKRIELLALAAIELADAMGYETTGYSETTEDVEPAEDGDTTEDSPSAEDK